MSACNSPRRIERGKRKVVYTDFEDKIGPGSELVIADLSSSIDAAQYQKKVQQFLQAHQEDAAIRKLRLNVPLTDEDVKELETLLYNLGGEGSRPQFERSYGAQESLSALVRRLVGLDREAAQRAFARYLEGSRYNANQIKFVNQVIDYLTQNGTMDAGLLYEQPFTAYSPLGLDGLFPDADAADIVQIIAIINQNAGIKAAPTYS